MKLKLSKIVLGISCAIIFSQFALKYLGLGIGYNFVAMNLEYSGSDDFL